MEKTFDIVSLGEILIDFVPDGVDEFGDEKYICKAGGAPLNVLATCAKSGMKTAFIGKVGSDIFGKKLLKTLEKYNVDFSSVIVDEIHNTTLAFVKLDENGDRDFSFYRGFGADIFINVNEVDKEKIKSSKIFHFGSLSFTDEPMKSATLFALKTAKENGCIVSYDPNYRPPLWKSEKDAVVAMRDNLKYADVVKLSKEELELITEESNVNSAIGKIKQYGVNAVVVTDGDNDIYFSADDSVECLPPVKVKAVDTTGAGDIFFGTFLTEFIKSGENMEKLKTDKIKPFVRKAIQVASQSVTRKGAIASIPDNII